MHSRRGRGGGHACSLERKAGASRARLAGWSRALIVTCVLGGASCDGAEPVGVAVQSILARDRRGVWRVAGTRSGPGLVRHDLAYANALGLSLAVLDGSEYRIVSYGRDDLLGGGGAGSCF